MRRLKLPEMEEDLLIVVNGLDEAEAVLEGGNEALEEWLVVAIVARRCRSDLDVDSDQLLVPLHLTYTELDLKSTFIVLFAFINKIYQSLPYLRS